MSFNLFDRTPHAWAKVAQWSDKRGEFVKLWKNQPKRPLDFRFGRLFPARRGHLAVRKNDVEHQVDAELFRQFVAVWRADPIEPGVHRVTQFRFPVVRVGLEQRVRNAKPFDLEVIERPKNDVAEQLSRARGLEHSREDLAHRRLPHRRADVDRWASRVRDGNLGNDCDSKKQRNDE